MVPGQDHQYRSGGVRQPSYYSQWLRDFSTKAPMFSLGSFVLDSRKYGLPQGRQRIYTVGLSRKFTATVPTRPLPFAQGDAPWSKILHPGLPPDREEHLTPQQKHNLKIVLKDIHQSGNWTNPISFSADRNPKLPFGAMVRRDGCCGTLRTSNEMIWLVWLNQDGSRSFSRPLHPIERFAVQGMNPDFAAYLTKKALN